MTQEGCDNCGRPQVEQIVSGFKANGERWEFTLCKLCSVRLGSIDYKLEDSTTEVASNHTREELLELLRRSK
jgi:hypothetical protein